MSIADENALVIRELLGAVDLDSSGFIDEVELAAVVDLSSFELKQIFAKLDTDKDGKISISDFMENYKLFQSYADVKETAIQANQFNNNIQASSNTPLEKGEFISKENSNDSGFTSADTALKAMKNKPLRMDLKTKATKQLG